MRELTTTVQEQLKELTSRTHAAAAQSWKQRRHLLETRNLTRPELDCFLDVAKVCKQSHKSGPPLAVLAGKTIAHIFYENSTRTRSSFEMAARQLGADVQNLDTKVSSVTKGETIVDTARQLVAMRVSAIVQRHSASGSAHLIARELGDKVHVLNAGDGWNGHPTQGLLDLLTMTEIRPKLDGLKIAIVGDITHSRVARSDIWLLKTLGANIHLAGPPTLIPPAISDLGVVVHNQLDPAIENADFIIMLRLQLERQTQGLIPSIGEYRRLFRLDHQRIKLAQPDVRILHPGPVNRGIEMTDELVDDPYYSLISTQVTNGVAARMAALYLLLAEHN